MSGTTETIEIVWLSLADAKAKVASRSTIYRRIEAGEYQSEKRGGRLWVGVPSSHIVEQVRQPDGTFGTAENVLDVPRKPDGVSQPSHGTNETSQTSHSHLSETIEALNADVERVSAERNSLGQENEILRVKLESSENEQDTIRKEVEHHRERAKTDAETIKSLTDEIKGLTIALHAEQNRHAIEAHSSRSNYVSEQSKEDEERSGKPKRQGFFTRIFRRKKQVRIGQA